ncbi:hypothetical protein IV500_19130 [Paeniglutamicibacter antarcticus]|uniref:Uncharacterized protein n=1 Tax=Arthrobacter terrae TaxID=2935737 RepID=A0A931CR44_9MICC|nr:hypothetical protein [Arthrobacter terrae]MBG0741482.1 hypothetical protein [Arthrobacter terrae]
MTIIAHRELRNNSSKILERVKKRRKSWPHCAAPGEHPAGYLRSTGGDRSGAEPAVRVERLMEMTRGSERLVASILLYPEVH